MDALKRLERAGWHFAPDAERVVYVYEPGGVPMAERPAAVQQVVYESYAADLAEVRARADEVFDILNARWEWETTFENHELWLASKPDFDEGGPMICELEFQARLAWLSEAAHWPYYDGGPVDKGPGGWRLLAEALRLEYDVLRQRRQAAAVAAGEPADDADDDDAIVLMGNEQPFENQTSDKESEAMGIKVPQTKHEVLEQGEYLLRITLVEQTAGKFSDQLQFWVEVADGPHKGLTFISWTNIVFSPKSKLYQWVQAARGGEAIPADYTLDTDDLIGREVVGYVILKELADGAQVNRVERVRAPRAVVARADW